MSLVFGTAGHIDHGKTALVRALTGIDTDRLEEEKKRGISIDLGFAHLEGPAGRCLSFIDVPGHERFVRNMLAGAAGIEAVLLIVAANESVKPQTREHLAICRLLGVERGLIVLTKTDLVDSGTLQKTETEVRALCAGTFLANAGIYPVSAKTGAGLAELRAALFSVADLLVSPDATNLARLPIDRSFSMAGFGTVVTGTLWSGRLNVGDVIEHFPSRRKLRIRGLEVHGHPVESAVRGERTAVNLAGADHTEIHRGDVIAQNSDLSDTNVLDVSVDWLNTDALPVKRQELLLHLGTAEVMAALKLWDAEGQFARLQLQRPLLAFPQDRFVLRRPSPALTIAGGSILDTQPHLRLNRTKTLARLQKLATSDLRGRIAFLVEESSRGLGLPDLVKATGSDEKHILAAVESTEGLLFAGNAGRILSRSWIKSKHHELVAWLRQFHKSHPAVEGAPTTQARLGLEPAIGSFVLQSCPGVVVRGDLVALEGHTAHVNVAQQRVAQQLEAIFREGGFQPPSLADALRTAGADSKESRGHLELLIKQNKLIRVTPELIFHADVFEHLQRSLASHKGRRFSVPEFKDWTKISRKYAIPLLEYLDRKNITRRDGDVRVVL